jgi:GT2 family glycosyltransferase
MTGPALSIVIPTYMRNEVLWDSVRALRPQLREGDELLIIDQNDPPLRAPGDLSGAYLKLLRLERPSLTRARNLGLARAASSLVVFLDDDIRPDADLLERFRQAAETHPRCILTGVVDQEDKPEDVPTPGWVDLDSGEIRTNFSRPVTGEVPFFPGCLFLLPKACLPPRPWFCPAFRGASQGEEIDFSLRARRRGVAIRADPSIRIYHLKAVAGGCRAPDFRRRFFLDQVHNQALFYARHGRFAGLPRFLGRLRGFVEFHSRREGARGHSPRLIAFAVWRLKMGFATGLVYRMRDRIGSGNGTGPD